MNTLALAFRLARRELRGGVRGFRIFIACLALGVGAIAAAGSLVDAFQKGLSREARTILGGDAEVRFSRRTPTPGEQDVMASAGTVARTLEVRTMAGAGEDRRLVELRAVDDAFPLAGRVLLDPPMALHDALARRDGAPGVVVEPAFLTDFNVALGDQVEMVGRTFIIRAVIIDEPDRLSLGFAFGPRAIGPWDRLADTDLTRPGSLFRISNKIAFPEGVDAEAAVKSLSEALGDDGVRVRDLDDAAGGVRNGLDQLAAFMSVAGLAALIAGGLGVRQAVDAFVEDRIPTIAVWKALGAEAPLIRAAYGLQIFAIALFGGLVGVALGALAPPLTALLFHDALPLPIDLTLSPRALGLALAVGLLAAAVFAAPAIGRARLTRPNALFRGAHDRRSGHRTNRPWPEWTVAGAAATAFVVVAVFGGRTPITSGALLGGAAVSFSALLGLALLIKFMARRFSLAMRGPVRMAFANLGGPHSLAPIAGPALGLGVAVVATILAIQTNLTRQLRETAPDSFPSLIVREIPSAQVRDFDALVRAKGAALDPDVYRRTPFLTGRIVKLNGADLDISAVAASERWVATNEIGLTFAGRAPPELELEGGAWWAPDHDGEPLISIEGDAARGLGVGVGDTLTMRILGREVTGRIANLRTIDWGGFGLNFAVVFAPGALEGANARHLAVIKTSPEREDALARALSDAFSTISIIRARQAFETAADLLEDIALAINVGAGVVALSGALVLIGAMAAATKRRRFQAALLRTLGATRAEVIAIFALEFAAAGALAALCAVALALGAAYFVVVRQFEAAWELEAAPILMPMLCATALCAIGGWLAARSALDAPPARILRQAG